ncbi:uncharacterized protein LOC135684941 [Rhopilema esculentum]|uniref:uncharacterized protein LOC135684941 n=1 Tax=Rhopilema esculentum TaxID=499914 RepID=UPI0031DF553E
MDRTRGEQSKSMLYSYYTLAHAMTPRRNSPTHGKPARKYDIESGDETDRSVDNEVIESFFMDEINENTESCSLNSSRENLLDGEPVKETKPNSRPGSARRASYRNPELPVDERIKVLEEGLKEADMEREVVLSCLGKEYLERITMQNCLQEICSKSGYSYEAVVSNIEAQSGAKNILENIIETRTKALLGSKERQNDTSEKPQKSNDNQGISEGEWDCTKTVPNSRHSEVLLDKAKEERLKEVLMKFTQAEKEKVNTGLNRKNDRHENSHTDETKGPPKGKQSFLSETTANDNSSVENKEANSEIDNKSIVFNDQSQPKIFDSLKTSKTTRYNFEKTSESCNPGRAIERSSLTEEKRSNSKDSELSGKHTSLSMPEKSERITLNSGNSILRSIELKAKGSSERNIDSIDEGILMIKTYLSELKEENKTSSQFSGVEHQITNQGIKRSSLSRESPERSRKFSLNETRRVQPELHDLPQRRSSFSEGTSMNKGKQTEHKSTVESRLFKPTVSSRNKVKDRLARKDTESDTEGGRKRSGRSKKAGGLKRSTSDVRHGPKRQFYSYTSAEEDSSIDGDTMERKDLEDEANPLHFVYDISPEVKNREHGKIMTILSMLQDQKRNWELESKALKEKLDAECKLRSDLAHDNNVLRKSLEAANHAIKEINSKVQELKLTIVPLREENSKLREQNQNVKAKLDLLRKDKTSMMQELQELRQSTNRFEERLQIISDLYRNGRLNLVDQNNNSQKDSESANVDLKILLEVSNDSEELGKSTVSAKRSNRGRDSLKRHSFHGFERIDELAGNAEELLAEKEKVEQENESLKKELIEMRERIKAERENDNECESDSVNRRKGWRMQREESKHRIIREILKTESNQVYGRPYASCTDLTLDDKEERAKMEMLALKQSEYNSRKRNEGKGGKGGMKENETDLTANSGGLSFTVKFEKKDESKTGISWKEESEKINKRLATCKFEKLKPKDVDQTDRGLVEQKKKDKRQSSQACVTSDDNKTICNKDTEKISEEWIQNTEETVTSLEAEYTSEQRNTFSFTSPFKGPVGSGLEEDVSRVEANGSSAYNENSGKRNGNGSKQKEGLFHSPQWPLVREKIQEIYKQPVEILEQSFVWKGSEKRDTSSRGQSIMPNVERHEWRRTNEHQNEAKHSMIRPESNSFSKATRVNGDVEDGKERPRIRDELLIREYGDGWKDGEDRTVDNNWQRKSRSEEIQSYEDYRRKLRQRELEKAYSNQYGASINGNEMTSDKDDNRNYDYEFNRSLEGKYEVAAYQATNSINEYKQKANEFSNGVQKSREDSSWVKVPVYLKQPKREESAGRSITPEGSFKHLETQGGSMMHEGSKLIEETITKVESAFATTKPAPKRVVSKRSNEKSKSSKISKEFVRRSPGTVMYLDELAEYDSDSSYDVPVPRRTKSLRKPRPKSDVFPNKHTDVDIFEGSRAVNDSAFRRNRSLRLPRKTKDDMFSVDISFENESQDDSAIVLHSEYSHSTPKHQSSFQSAFVQSDAAYCNYSYSGSEEQKCQHHQPQRSQADGFTRARFQSETGTSTTRSSGRRSKSPGGFSCEMCREMSRKKSSQEKYCWEKYFPIGETTVETRIIKEDYV